MKRLLPYLIVFTLSFYNSLFSQNPPPPEGTYGIIITTQAEVNSFQTDYPSTDFPDGIFIGGEDIIDLMPLQHILSISALSISDNTNLTSLIGLKNLINVPNLKIDNNAQLSSISGLESIILDASTNSIKITNNPLLSDCALSDLCDYISESTNPEQLLVIENNAQGCNSIFQLGQYCGPPACSESEITIFTRQAQIDQFVIDFPNCESFYGLRITGNDITDLTPLSQIKNIRTSLKIENNPNLTSLNGLENISNIYSGTSIINNDKLQNLAGITVSAIYHGLFVSDNDILTDFSGLNIQDEFRMSGALRVVNNVGLESLQGLELLTSMSRLWINGNNNLTDISALENLDSYSFVDESVTITNNTSLSECSIESVCIAVYYAIDTGRGFYATIENNALGCNNYNEVLSSCSPTDCPPANSVESFNNQAQIDQFIIEYPNCTELPSLNISGEDIVNLNGLMNIKTIAAGPHIINNPMLTNLEGLNSLEFYGRGFYQDFFDISNNPMLEDISALSNLTSFEGTEIYITQNPSLKNLKGLESMNPEAFIFLIIDNANLTSLEGLENFKITENLTISNNPNLTSLSGLQNFETIYEFQFSNNDKISTLSTLDNISPVNILIITENELLENIDVFNASMPYQFQHLIIENNPNLSACSTDYICLAIQYLDPNVGYGFSITNNAEGCLSIEQVQETCNPSPCPETTPTFTSQSQIDQFIIDFPNCTELGRLLIEGNDITNLNGLSNLVNINGNITIRNTTTLVNLDPLSSLVSFGDGQTQAILTVENNALLDDFIGLDNLVNNTIFDVIVNNNPSLLTLDGLQGITGEGFTIYLQNNQSLFDLEGLVNVTNVEDLTIIDNPQLSDINGLANITNIGGGLDFINNDNVTSLSVLDGAAMDCSFVVTDNESLTELADFGYFDTGCLPSATITNNPNLSVCDNEFVCLVIDNSQLDPTSNSIEISNNAEGCNSIAQVEAACNPSVCPEITPTFTSQAQIDQFIIDYPNCKELENVQIEGLDIINLNGLANIEQIAGLSINNTSLINLSGLQAIGVLGSDFSSVIRIENNEILENISALSNATNTYYFDLSIKNNPTLMSLDGLQGVLGEGFIIRIENNDSLLDLQGLSGITFLEVFHVKDNLRLSSLSGLTNLTKLNSLTVDNNDMMDSLNSLGAIELFSLIVQNNEGLQDIGSFKPPTFGEPNLKLFANPLLSTCDSDYVCKILELSIEFPFTTIEISNNAEGCNSIAQVKAACNTPVCPEITPTFTSQAQIDQFIIDYPNCTELMYLIINGGDISNLAGLSNIKTISEGGISILNTVDLSNLNGLESIISFGFSSGSIIRIENNVLLEGIQSLFNATNASEFDLFIKDNPSLLSLDGLQGLTGTGFQVQIFNNSTLYSLDGLSNVTTIDDLILRNNSQMDNVFGLNSLASISSFEFIDNDEVVSFLPFDEIDIDGGIRIIDNDKLTSIEGFNSISVETDLEITGNISLSTCDASYVCEILAIGNRSEFLVLLIENNAEGCNSITQVEEACNPPACPTSLITLSSQAEVNEFPTKYPNCTEITDGLVISGPDIFDLTPLSQLTKIETEIGTDALVIANNPNLSNLFGLHNLNIVQLGEFRIENNISLVNIDALLGISGYFGDFTIKDNPLLSNLNGLSNITYFSYLIIDDNDSLTSLTGLDNVFYAERLYIQNNDGLSSLSGLENLETIYSLLRIISNSSLQDLNGFVSLTSVIGVRIQGNNNLVDISGLDSIEDVSRLTGVSIFTNFNLSLCDTDFICRYLAQYDPNTFQNLDISNNAEGCDNISQVEAACNPPNPNCQVSVTVEIGRRINYRGEFVSQSLNLPSCNVPASGTINDVWFKFNSGNDTSFSINVTRNYFLQLWTGDCTDLAQVPDACDRSRLRDIPLDQNTDYYIQVWEDTSGARTRNAEVEFEIVVESESTLSLSDDSLDLVKISPNPVEATLKISVPPGIDIKSIALFSIQGKEIETFNQLNLDLSNLATGIYFIKLTSDQNRVITKKIVKL